MMKVGKVYRDKMVTTIKEGVSSEGVSILVNYKSISSGDISSLRKVLQQKKARMYSSRNSLVKVALKDTDYMSLADGLDGQTAFIWTSADVVEISKVLSQFSAKNENFVIRGGILDKAVLKKDDVKRLAELPSREVLLAKILGALQSPATRLARALKSKQTDLTVILKQLSEKKGGN
jgi:large subunit ribosomal protein L10